MVDGGKMDPEKTEQFKEHEGITKNFLEKEEAKDASALEKKDSSSLTPEEKEKIEGKKKEEKSVVDKAEAKAKEDEKILDTPDEELDETGKTRKAELVLAKEEKKTPEEKKEEAKKEDQSRIDKRFGELTGELKDLKKDKVANKEQITAMEKTIADLNNKLNPDKINEAKKVEESRISKYLEEDKDKPREQKREMSKDDLEEWLLEDAVEANEWMVERSLRRSAERREATQNDQKEIATKELVAKWEESSNRVEEKHPELNTRVRVKELEDEGKSNEEVTEILCKENEKFRIMTGLMKNSGKKYWGADGPELMMVEMEKLLVKEKPEDKDKGKDKAYTQSEIDKIKQEAIEAEDERRANIDEGNSSNKGKDHEDKTTYDADTEKKIKAICKRSGISRKEFDKAIADRKMRIPA